MDRFIEEHRESSSSPCLHNLSASNLNEQHEDNWIEMRENDFSSRDGMHHASSRFRVAPVDVARDTNGRSSPDSVSHDEFSSPVGSFAQRTLGYTNSYDTKNLKSLRHYTRDALPRADHYRNILSVHGHLSRPTLDELHGGQHTVIIEASVSTLT